MNNDGLDVWLKVLDGETWRTKNGLMLPPAQMDSDHIRNCLRLLDRWANPVIRDVWVLAHYANVPWDELGDGACMAVEHEMYLAGRQSPQEWMRRRPIYRALTAELERRGETVEA